MAEDGTCPVSIMALDNAPQSDVTLNSRPATDSRTTTIAPPTDRDLQAAMDSMKKIHDEVYNSTDMFFRAFMIASVLIVIVPVYVFVHERFKMDDRKATSLMVSTVALMILGILAMQYFT